MNNWKHSGMIRVILGLLLIPGLFLDVLAGSYLAAGREYAAIEAGEEREFFLSQKQTSALLDGYIRLLEQYMQIGALITKDGDIDYDKEILYSLTSERSYTIKELLKGNSAEGVASDILQDFMKDFASHSQNGESFPWRVHSIMSSDTRVIISGEDILAFDSPNFSQRSEKVVQEMQERLPNMIPLTTDDKTFLEDTQDQLLVDLEKSLNWEYEFHARSRYEEYIISYFRDYAACYFLNQLCEGAKGSEPRIFLEIYEKYEADAGARALSKTVFLERLQEEYQKRYDKLTAKDFPWKAHLIPRTLDEAKKYVAFLVEMYQQLTYLFAKTNFFYAYENTNGLLLTNHNSAWDIVSQQMEVGRVSENKEYAFISYMNRTKQGISSLKTTTLPMSGDVMEKLKSIGENFNAGSFQIMVGIDLDGVWNQSKQDEFVTQYQDSLRKRDMYEEGKVYGTIGLLLTFLVLLLLFARTGTPVGSRTSAMYFYDKIWLEFQLLAGFLLLYTMIWLTRLCSGYSNQILLILYSSVMTVFLFFFCLLCLSIGKRMKLKQTRKYSLLGFFVDDVLVEKLSFREFVERLNRRLSFASPGKRLRLWLFLEIALLFYLAVSAGVIYYRQDLTVRGYVQSVFGWIAGIWLLLFGVFLYFWQRRQMQNEVTRQNIIRAMRQIIQGNFAYVLPEQETSDALSQELTGMVNQIGGVLERMVEENVRNERMKTELIANVSHDLKTPLTSIINYVDILQGEDLKEEEVQRYLQILEQKALRLKVLMEDLIEASKASSGAIELQMNSIDFRELLYQAGGEFAERFAAEKLEMVTELPEHPVYFEGDGRRVFRILENLYGNVAKYAMQNTRVYITLAEERGQASFTMKNISSQKLNITPEELTERFVRGDHARTTEGSGLGLSIAKSLTELMGGEFTILVDGDLFCSVVRFPLVDIKNS